MKKSILLFLALIMCMVIGLVGCSNNSVATNDKQAPAEDTADAVESEQPVDEDTGSDGGDAKYTVGFLAGDIGHTFHIRVWKSVQLRGKELGIDVVVLDSKRDLSTESSNVDNLISMGVDAVMIMPCNMEGSVPAFKRVQEAGIPVLAVVDQAEGMPYVGSDLVDGGGAEMAFEYLAKDLNGKGNVTYIKGGPGVAIQRLRTEGVYRVLDKNPELKITFEQHGDWARTSGANLMQDALAASPNKGDIQAVFADDDVMTLGALEVIKSEGRLEDPILAYGCCGDGGFLEAIKNGEAKMTAFQNGEFIGCKAIETVARMLKGEEVEQNVNVPWTAITQENVQEFLDRWDENEGIYSILDEYKSDI
jgi:ABC-type sugar transport system substrate-binding protein